MGTWKFGKPLSKQSWTSLKVTMVTAVRGTWLFYKDLKTRYPQRFCQKSHSNLRRTCKNMRGLLTGRTCGGGEVCSSLSFFSIGCPRSFPPSSGWFRLASGARFEGVMCFCLLTWMTSLSRRANAFLHTSHTYGFSPVWILMWITYNITQIVWPAQVKLSYTNCIYY